MRFYPILAVALAVTACSPSPDAGIASNSASTANAAAPVAANRSAPAVPVKAQPIRLSQKTDALEFDYRIPAAAAAIPDLANMLRDRAEKGKASILKERADYDKDMPADAPRYPFSFSTDWSVAADLPQLLVLESEGYQFTGGAHGMPIYQTLYWDKVQNHEIPLDALFTHRAKALATVHPAFCAQLDRQRAKKRNVAVADLKKDAGPVDDFTACPAFGDGIEVVFTHPVGGKFGRIDFIVPPYVAGPYAEGDYRVELPIPKAMIPYIAKRYRPSFPGTGG
ncbi:DUF3298 and DUF4163 domain-containing protein [Stakelama sediminis]|uniref:Deacetylase PdaC domain-containing protein n=1 Tax=Stakelama sediminis TaxID=463200 RepID=A0A840YZW9_9SPHN|nr:DUF4163 domain-containing protein [Stakelama sediminis]MBB5719165.1 hypothetical protein [Stakelama sediminis]